MASLSTLSVVGIAAASGVVALALAIVLAIFIVRMIHKRRQKLAQRRYRSLEPPVSRRKVISKLAPHVQFGSVTYFPDDRPYWKPDSSSARDLEKGESTDQSCHEVGGQQHPATLGEIPLQEPTPPEQPVLAFPRAAIDEKLPPPLEHFSGMSRGLGSHTPGTTCRLDLNLEADRPSTAPTNSSESGHTCHCRAQRACHGPQLSWSSSTSASAPPKAPPPAVPSWALHMRKSLPIFVSRAPSHDSLVSVGSSGSSILKRAMSPSTKASVEFAERNPDAGLGVQVRDVDIDIKDVIMSGPGEIPAQCSNRSRSRSPSKKAAIFGQQALVRQVSVSSSSQHPVLPGSGKTAAENSSANKVAVKDGSLVEGNTTTTRNSVSSSYSLRSDWLRSVEQTNENFERTKDKSVRATIGSLDETRNRSAESEVRRTRDQVVPKYCEATSRKLPERFEGRFRTVQSSPVRASNLSHTGLAARNKCTSITEIPHQHSIDYRKQERGDYGSASPNISFKVNKEYWGRAEAVRHSTQIPRDAARSSSTNDGPLDLQSHLSLSSPKLGCRVMPPRTPASVTTPQRLDLKDNITSESVNHITPSGELKSCGTKLSRRENTDYQYLPSTKFNAMKLGNPMQNRPDLWPNAQPYSFKPRPPVQPRERAAQSVEMTICSLRHMASQSSTASATSSLYRSSPDQVSREHVLGSSAFELKDYGLVGKGKGTWKWGGVLVERRQQPDESLADERTVEQAWRRLGGAQSRGSLYDDEGFLRQDM